MNPGQYSLATKAYMSMPMMAVGLAAAAVIYGYPTPAKTLASQSAGTCQSRYCGPTQMFVDNPKNTLLKDQSLETGLGKPSKLPWLVEVYQKLESDYTREQARSPGVNLVAHYVSKRE